MVETETLDAIVDALANGDFCANQGKLLKKRFCRRESKSEVENNVKLQPFYSQTIMHTLTGDERCLAVTVVDTVKGKGFPC